MKPFCILFFFILNAISLQAQERASDVTVILHEQTLNKLFTALGPVYGSGDFSILFYTGVYHWTLLNPHIELKNGGADYVADVEVESGILSYKTKVTGDVTITYAADSNKIVIRITKALLPLYTKLFGSRIHIKDIDLALSYKEPFLFDGPLSMTSDMEFTMPDGTVRRVHAAPTHCKVIVEENRIVVPCEIEYSTQSIKK